MVEYLFIGYYVVCIVYLITKWIGRKGDWLLGSMMALLIPFFGLPLAILRDFAGSKAGSSEIKRFVDLIDGNERQDRIFTRIDVDKEVNIAPLEEVLLVNDLATRRRLLLDVLKEDMDEKMIPLLERAASNEDTETSHYAVTALMEMKRKMLLDIQKWSVRYEEQSNDSYVMRHYANAIKQYMMSGFMDSRMQMSQRMNYVNLLDRLLDSEMRSEELFKEKISSEIELGRYEEGLRYSLLFRKYYPDNEDAYLTALNLYYSLKKNDSFYETLEALKLSKIRVSNTALNVIRYWSVKGA